MEANNYLGDVTWGTSEPPRSMMNFSQFEEFFDERNQILLQKHCIPNEEGSGTVYHYWGRDVNFVIGNCRYNEKKEYTVQWNDWITFSFTLQSMLSVENKTAKTSFVHSDMTWCILRETPGTSKRHTIDANGNLKWATLACSQSYLENILGCKIGDYRDADDQPVLSDVFFFNISRFNPIILNAVDEIFRLDMPIRLFANFLHAKADHLISLSLSALLSKKPAKTSLPHADLSVEEAVHRAAKIIDNSLSDPPTLEMIGEFVGLDRATLISGFQNIYGPTPSEYLKEKQLEEAGRLLEKTKMPLSEISARVGYRHQCNLSTAFRSKFGISPLGYRKQKLARATVV